MRAFSASLWMAFGLFAIQAPARSAPIDLPDIPRCTELTPGAISIDSTPVTLSLRVVLDGVSVNQAQGIVDAALATYVPLGVSFTVAYEQASFGQSDGLQLLEETKNYYGGMRPAGTHLVYVLTSKDLSDATVGDALAGQADCIGGVVYDDSAFAVGEYHPELGATTMAHELGHLFGGHHHYANCAEALLQGGGNLCTLMFNDVGFAALDFSSLNGTVVRGHAQLAGGSAGNAGVAPPANAQPQMEASTSSSAGSGGGAIAWISLLLLAVAARYRRG